MPSPAGASVRLDQGMDHRLPLPAVDADPAAGVDEREMAELRAFADELVRAGGGVPRRLGYRPRLESPRRKLAAAPVELLSAVGWAIGAWVRDRPARTAVVALAGVAVVAGGLALRWALTPGHAPVELRAAVPPPAPVAASLAPPPPVAVPSPVVAPAPALPATNKHTPARAARTTMAKHQSAAPRHREKVGSRLGQLAMIDGMRSIQPQVNSCYRKYGERGVANVGVEVGSDGRVTGVTVAGPLADTPTAACVQAAVRSARFRGGGARFRYPLVLQ